MLFNGVTFGATGPNLVLHVYVGKLYTPTCIHRMQVSLRPLQYHMQDW